METKCRSSVPVSAGAAALARSTGRRLQRLRHRRSSCSILRTCRALSRRSQSRHSIHERVGDARSLRSGRRFRGSNSSAAWQAACTFWSSPQQTVRFHDGSCTRLHEAVGFSNSPRVATVRCRGSEVWGMTPLRLLLIEDSENDARLVVHELTCAGFTVALERVETADALAAALARERWDLAIADYTMPQFTGTAALQPLRQYDPDMPFIFVSGTIGEDIAVEAMKTGAHDYIIKGHLKRLGPAVQRELREAEG